MAASEFGGEPQANGIQPRPHQMTAHEKLMLLYRTGTEETQDAVPDQGETFAGLLTLAQQTEIRAGEGVLEKGQVWEEMQNG